MQSTLLKQHSINTNRAREQQIPKCNEIVEKLDPIIQATKLLQTKKTEEHIPTIVEMCYRLR